MSKEEAWENYRYLYRLAFSRFSIPGLLMVKQAYMAGYEARDNEIENEKEEERGKTEG